MYFGFKNIAVDYGKKKVLSGLSLDVPKGKIMTLIGQNGCGKSTLLRPPTRQELHFPYHIINFPL